ncbi:hypothetical protein ACFWPU_00555 [Streptomyces sp. NPDC058471]|uniref:hypothetical protein n=1 Tax=Streptomyces sp. NPDC058471 TaxID=3346516 RepID=UPI0036629A91
MTKKEWAELADSMRAQRTLTAAQVDHNAFVHDMDHLTPEEWLEVHNYQHIDIG